MHLFIGILEIYLENSMTMLKMNLEITNYGAALQRDFGLTMRYVQKINQYCHYFEKKEINDFIPMAIYRALVWKKNQLEKINELENEKNKTF